MLVSLLNSGGDNGIKQTNKETGKATKDWVKLGETKPDTVYVFCLPSETALNGLKNIFCDQHYFRSLGVGGEGGGTESLAEKKMLRLANPPWL